MIAAMVMQRNHHNLTEAVVAQILDEPVDHVMVIDNESTDRCCQDWFATIGDHDPRIQTIRHPGKDNFYGAWNLARQITMHLARPDEDAHLAILNNDITMVPNTLVALSQALRDSDDDVWITYPDWQSGQSRLKPPHTVTRTKGTRNRGGMCGYCFMLDVHALARNNVPLIDEQFELICGDGDLVMQVQQRGGTAARVDGWPVGHTESTTQHDPRNAWTKAARRRDRERRAAKYGKGPTPHNPQGTERQA